MPHTCIECKVKAANYGMPTDRVRNWCATCAPKDRGAIYLNEPTLCVDGCGRRRSYGLPGEKVRWCATCSKRHEGAVRLWKTLKCEEPTCESRARYGQPDDETRKRRWCSEHKEKGAINLDHKKTCEDCTAYAYYGFDDDERKIRWCREHKAKGAVNLYNKQCEEPGCDTRCTYGYEAEGRARWCAKHAPNDTKDVKTRRCETDGCDGWRLYAFEGEPAKYCHEHALTGMINVMNPKCENDCGTFVPKKGDLCAQCDRTRKRHGVRVRETRVKNYLDDNGFQYTSWNKQADEKACGRYRPDLVFDCGTHVVLLEVDEDAHETYARECEAKRVMDLFGAYGGLPVAFLRFNPPDAFGDDEKAKHKRMADELTRLLETPSSYPLTITYLYYPGEELRRVRVENTHVYTEIEM